MEYLPIDEKHPVLATDSYSFSKHVVEEIGRYFWQRCGISSLSLRIPEVVDHSRLRTEYPVEQQQREGWADIPRGS